MQTNTIPTDYIQCPKSPIKQAQQLSFPNGKRFSYIQREPLQLSCTNFILCFSIKKSKFPLLKFNYLQELSSYLHYYSWIWINNQINFVVCCSVIKSAKESHQRDLCQKKKTCFQPMKVFLIMAYNIKSTMQSSPHRARS